MPRKLFWVVFRAALALVSAPLLLSLLLIGDAYASGEKVLYTFTGGKDGSSPVANLVFDSAGNLYGTTRVGGAHDFGTVFQLTPGKNGSWTQSTIYTFTGGNDGGEPSAGLIIDAQGNLYGTTSAGGTSSHGTVFELSLSGGIWKEKVLHSFTGLSDGGNPQAGLVFDSVGNLYGTASEGGSHEYGAVFMLKPGSNGKWTNKTLHNFNNNGRDGYGPLAGLVIDSAGNLYGTTNQGGKHKYGVVFQLVPGTNGGWTEHIIHGFNPANGKDGAYPECGLAIDALGNLYGTTNSGGKSEFYGIAFQLSLGTNGIWVEKILHQFTGGSDGSEPNAGLIMDAAGKLYGTTSVGGKDGLVFRLTLGSNGKWGETVLHNFSGGSDGATPEASLVLDASGHLYGTTKAGGTGGSGVVFQVTP